MFLSLFASLSTLIGFIFVKKINEKSIYNLIKLASGIMISLSIFELIPESFIKLNIYFKVIPSIMILLIFINIGLIISSLINNHIKVEDNIYRVGIMGMIAIILHNIPEGIITYMASDLNIKLGFKLAISIALHNIPEGILVAYPIYYSTKSYSRAFVCTFISGISEFIGSIIALIIFGNINNDLYIALMLSITAGIMIYISIYDYMINKNRGSVGELYFLLGIFIMFIIILI